MIFRVYVYLPEGKFDDVKSIFFSRIIIRLKVFDGTMMLRHGKSGKTYGILGVSMVFLSFSHHFRSFQGFARRDPRDPQTPRDPQRPPGLGRHTMGSIGAAWHTGHGRRDHAWRGATTKTHRKVGYYWVNILGPSRML